MKQLRLFLTGPEGTVLDAPADLVRMEASDGSFGVMPGHAPAAALLPAGTVFWREGSREQTISIAGGICEIRDNVITILLSGSVEKGEDHADPSGER